jgi:hypothetical protein
MSSQLCVVEHLMVCWVSPLHGLPPSGLASTATCLVLVCAPTADPHDTEHDDHSDHDEYSQSAGLTPARATRYG